MSAKILPKFIAMGYGYHMSSVRQVSVMSKKIIKTSFNPEALQAIRFLMLDVDGVMTDGSIIYTNSGEEAKVFDVKDGAGLKYWVRAGHAAGIVTGRGGAMVERRAAELDIAYLEMGALQKLPAFDRILAAAGVRPDEVAMIGDDLPDLPILRRVGFPVAVADAVDEVKDAAALVTERSGGKGAVREVIEYILRAQGRWDGIMERYLRP